MLDARRQLTENAMTTGMDDILLRSHPDFLSIFVVDDDDPEPASGPPGLHFSG